MRDSRGFAVAAFAAAILFAVPAPAAARTITFVAHLTEEAEVPPNDSKGHGDARLSYDTDTKQLDYFVTYDGVSATAIDIRGPAAPGSNAKAVINFPVPDSPVSGTATLTSDQAAALMAGRLYVEVHTAAHAAGEIRGQIESH